MRACVHTYISICIYICTYIHAQADPYIHICIYIHVRMYVYMYIFRYIEGKEEINNANFWPRRFALLVDLGFWNAGASGTLRET